MDQGPLYFEYPALFSGVYFLLVETSTVHTTVASETLEGVFLPDNSMNIHHRTLKPSAMCFYWPV